MRQSNKKMKYVNAEMIKDFGRRVAALRKKHGFTACGMAEDLGMSAVNLSRIERGEQFCKIDNIVLIAQYLDTSIDYLIFGYESEGGVGTFRTLIRNTDSETVMKALKLIEEYLIIEKKAEGGDGCE